MIKYKDNKTLNYTSVQLFDLVANIEKYPEFIPWIDKAKILRVRGNIVNAELFINYKKLNSRFTSKVILERPDNENEVGSIRVSLIEGPFKHLLNEWKFTPCKDGTEVMFIVEFAFRSRILHKAMEPIFNRAAHKITNIFEKRAKEIYKDI